MQTLKDNNLTGSAATSRRRQRGFTLIELVVVLAVLGVLAAIGIPQLTGLQQTAELRGISANLASEAGNLFAQDLASGAIGNEDAGDTNNAVGTINWNNPCSALNGNNDTSDPVLPSTEDLPAGWKIDNSEDGEYGFTVPTFNGDEITDGETCYLVEGTSE